MKLFGRSSGGFFIEAGAHNGHDISNTLYLEKTLGWTGILVEPNPDTFAGKKFQMSVKQMWVSQKPDDQMSVNQMLINQMSVR